MTAQEAFAIAFDEAPDLSKVAEDKKPKKGSWHKGTLKNAAKTNLAAAETAETSMGPQKSLSEHKAEGCEAEKNGHPERCPYVQRMAKDFEKSQGLTHEMAMQKALEAHSGVGMNPAHQPQQKPQASGKEQSQVPQQQQAAQPPQPNPASQSQMIQAMVENPSTIPDATSEQLAEPKAMETTAGEMTAQTTVQEASIEKLEKDIAAGIPEASATLESIKDSVSENAEANPPEGTDGGQQISEQAQQPEQPERMTITSKSGETFHLPPEAEAIITADPNKKDILQQMVDMEYDMQNATSNQERADKARAYEQLNIMFWGDGSEAPATVQQEQPEQPTPQQETPQQPQPAPQPSPRPQQPSTPQPQPETPEEQPPQQPTEKTDDKPVEKAPSPSPTPSPSLKPSGPSDEKFRVGKDKYKVGGMTYTDVSGKGLLRGMASAFFAGLRGEGIITGWDRISGAWDAMKRSEKGEMVRDGIVGSLFANTINEFANKSGLSDDARIELEAVQDMLSEAKTANQRMSAIKAFHKWKEKYSNELGEKTEATGDFANVAQKAPQWKAPPTTILPEVPEDERDTEFMEKMHDRIVKNLQEKGIEADILEKINGSSVVQFKIQRAHDGTDKALRDALNAMQADIGAQISYSPDLTSGAERMGTITINNPKVKDASLRRLLEDKAGVDAASKMAAPLLIGETADGKAVWVDASEHGFLGGDSGGGKSERLLGMVAGAFAVKPPSELQVIFNAHANAADFEDYENDPHTGAVGHDIKEVAQNLANANAEWKRRQKLFASMGLRNLKDYNKAMEKAGTPEKKLPQILVITDEVTNLLSERPDLADQIRGIVTNGRKFGVAHIGATQDMKATNMPTDIKGSLRMGVKATKKEAPAAIFDKYTDELGKLNGKGDIMYRDGSGNLVRLRGTFASPEARAKLRDYNTGKITAPESPAENQAPKPSKLPQGYSSMISEAINKGRPIQIEKDDSYDEEFKKMIPEGWEITELEEDGKKYLKATPKKNTDGSPESGKEKDEESDWRSAGSRKEAVEYLDKKREEAQAKAKEDFKKSKNTSADKTKFQKAMAKADADFQSEMESVNLMFGDTEDMDGIGESEQAPTEMPSESEPEEEDEDDDSPQKLMERAKTRLKSEREKINKSRDAGKMSEREARKRKQELSKRYKAAEEKFKAGATADEILNELEPEENQGQNIEQPKKDTETTVTETPSGGRDEEIDQEAEAAKQQAEKDAALSKTVKPSKFYGGKSLFGSDAAAEMLTPKEQKKFKETLVPPGWDFVTENGFNSPARTESGKIFVKHPTNGSYGWIYKDPKDGKMKLWKEVDTTHPDYKGFVQNEQGEWELSPEAKAIEKETKHIRKYSDNEKERDEAQKKLNNARYGRDEAPDNRAIVADAVAKALALLKD